nr:hypothetical protein CFP56_20434 [Quercus suber]
MQHDGIGALMEPGQDKPGQALGIRLLKYCTYIHTADGCRGSRAGQPVGPSHINFPPAGRKGYAREGGSYWKFAARRRTPERMKKVDGRERRGREDFYRATTLRPFPPATSPGVPLVAMGAWRGRSTDARSESCHSCPVDAHGRHIPVRCIWWRPRVEERPKAKLQRENSTGHAKLGYLAAATIRPRLPPRSHLLCGLHHVPFLLAHIPLCLRGIIYAWGIPSFLCAAGRLGRGFAIEVGLAAHFLDLVPDILR